MAFLYIFRHRIGGAKKSYTFKIYAQTQKHFPLLGDGKLSFGRQMLYNGFLMYFSTLNPNLRSNKPFYLYNIRQVTRTSNIVVRWMLEYICTAESEPQMYYHQVSIYLQKLMFFPRNIILYPYLGMFWHLVDISVVLKFFVPHENIMIRHPFP